MIYSEGMCSSASCHSAISEGLFQFIKERGDQLHSALPYGEKICRDLHKLRPSQSPPPCPPPGPKAERVDLFFNLKRRMNDSQISTQMARIMKSGSDGSRALA